ncbi:WD40 repeat domain-containing serine/threonine protein kinase [Anthocerotibacter panamensis]|uniref:WD40 repeat domain-containing serine/threonine protein kinase n=1 Tax=Anthocerotibacter panamensis TaxID=2857077 RepID=UPI001C403BE6|nr:serine/threonine-protein kinase [Anthocerotibacter panamensis]
MPLTCVTCGVANPDGAAHCRSCKTPLQQLLYALSPGTPLQGGKYRIDRVVGEGGFGITYLAIYQEKPVAIKEFFPRGSAREVDNRPILPAGFARSWFERTREQFLAEVRLLLPLEHPHIVKVYDCFQEHDTAYMVMEFIKGRTLGALGKARGPLAPQEALRYLLQVGVALDTLHRHGLVHRDVKSENVLLDERQRAVLIDFGSMQPEDLEAATVEYSIVSHGFSPPELYRFQSRYGPTVDIYALAAMAYNLLTGQIPTPAPERLKGHPIESIRTFNKLVGTPLEQALFQGLALDPAQRPTSALGLVRSLGTPVAPRPAAPQPPQDTVRPTPRVVQLLEALEGHQAEVKALAFSPDGRLVVSSSQDHIHFWEIQGARKLFTLPERHVNVLAFTPDGKGLFMGDAGGGLRLWRMATGQAELCLPPSPQPQGCQGLLSADSRWWVVPSRRQEIEVFRVATGRSFCLLEEPWMSIQALALSPDGTHLALARKDGKVKLWQTQTRAVLGIRNNYQQIIKTLVFDPQTKALICADAQGSFILWDWAQGRESLVTSQGLIASDLGCHLHARLLVVTGTTHPFWQFWSLPATGGTLVQTPVKLYPPSPVHTFALHPTELLLATAHRDGQIYLWQV